MSDNFYSTKIGTTVMGHLNLISGQTHQTGIANIPGKIANGSIIGNVEAAFDDCAKGTPAAAAFLDRCGYGIRLPLLAISPFARRNFVDRAVTDQTSILRFIEDNWRTGFIDGAQAPPAGQGSFDRLAGSLTGLFDFRNQPDTRALILGDPSGEPAKATK